MKSVEGREYLSMLCNVGDRVTVEGVDWYCLEPCTLTGATVEGDLPVVAIRGVGSFVATTQFIRVSECTERPQKGIVKTETREVAKYQQITPDDLVGKEIDSVRFYYGYLTLITTDYCYVKLSTEDGCVMEQEDLDMMDLLKMGRLAGQAKSDYWQEKAVADSQREESEDLLNLGVSIKRLGVSRVLQILSMEKQDDGS